MAGTDPTVEVTINDVFQRLGNIEGSLEKLWGAHTTTNTQLAVLDATLTMRCAQHQKDIDAVAEANRDNGRRIGTLETMASNARAGWTTAKLIWTIVATTITTVSVVAPILIVVLRHFLTAQ